MSKEIYLKLTVSPPPPLGRPKKLIRILGFAIVVVCLILLGSPQSLSFGEEEELQNEAQQTQNPTQITIQKIAIDLPIKETKVEGERWEINPNGPSHLNISSDPGAGGNIIIYDHNTWTHFGKITQLKNGDLIEIKTDSGKIFSYKVYKTIVVNPTDIHVLKEYGIQTLTLYTCAGFLDSKRFVLKAERI